MTKYTDEFGIDVYMGKSDYDKLQESADWLNNLENDLNTLRNAHSALYEDNSRSVTREDFEEAITAFEQSQKRVIAAMDALLP